MIKETAVYLSKISINPLDTAFHLCYDSLRTILNSGLSARSCNISNFVEMYVKFSWRKDGYLRAEEIKDKILFQVMNAEKNQELLEQVPHDRYLDLAIVFFYMEEGEDCRQKVYLFDNRQLEYYGLTKERLKTWAMENTPRLLPVSFHSMEDILREFHIWEKIGGGTEKLPLYVLTNAKMFLGAACVFYPEVLSSIGNAVQTDYYILPSSIHECIILPASSGYSREELEEIVRQVNEAQVPEQEILSNHVYFYDKAAEKMYN